MNAVQFLTLTIIAVVAIAVLVFLIWKNQKDKKTINPDAQDAVEETRMDQKLENEK